MTTELAQPESTSRQLTPVQSFIGNVLYGDKRDEIKRALPIHVPFDRFERNLSNALMRDPNLLQVDPRKVFREIAKIAALGLVLDPQLGEAYLIADRRGDVQARVGYRGLLKLAHQSGYTSTIYAHEICENDTYEIDLGTEKKLVHKPNFMKPRGQVGAYYAVVMFKDGSSDFEVMALDEVHSIRDRSDAWRAYKANKIKATPWSTDEGEMAKKTVLRRLLKRVSMSADVDRALSMENEADQRESRTIEGSVVPQVRPATIASRFDAYAAEEPEIVDNYDQETGEIQESGAEPATTDAPPPSPETSVSGEVVQSPATSSPIQKGKMTIESGIPIVVTEKELLDLDYEALTAAAGGMSDLQDFLDELALDPKREALATKKMRQSWLSHATQKDKDGKK